MSIDGIHTTTTTAINTNTNHSGTGSAIGELRQRSSSSSLSPTSCRSSSSSPLSLSLPRHFQESSSARSAVTSSMTLRCDDGDVDESRHSKRCHHHEHHQHLQQQHHHQPSPTAHKFPSKRHQNGHRHNHNHNHKQIQKLSTMLFLSSLASCLFVVGRIHSRAMRATSSSSASSSSLFASSRRRTSFEWDAPSTSSLRHGDDGGDARTSFSPRTVRLSEYHFPNAATTVEEEGNAAAQQREDERNSWPWMWQLVLSLLLRGTAEESTTSNGRRIVDDPMLYNTDRVGAEVEMESGSLEMQQQTNTETQTQTETQARSERERGQEEQAEKDDEEQCVPMADWQTTSYPNCNSIHEIDLVLSSGSGSRTFSSAHPTRRHIAPFPRQLQRLIKRLPKDKSQRKRKHNLNAKGIMAEDDVTFLGQGWFRSAWKVEGMGVYDENELERANGEDDDDGGGIEGGVTFDEAVVLKTLRIERDFLEEYYELHRRDALAMERLTFSPYVMNIYGYCGQSAVNELANFGIEGLSSLEKISRQFRGLIKIEPISKIKLQLAAMVSTGVSHVHSIDYPDHGDNSTGKSNATMVHYDLNPRNIAIIERGRPKLNDFNVAEFMMWNPNTQRPCGFRGRFREPWWRAPEEMHYHQTGYEPQPLTEKVDIYALGNILFHILTTHSPRGKMTSELQEGVRPKVARGELPVLPPEFQQTKDPALVAIREAMHKCLRAEPEERPTAGEIAEELNRAIDNLPEGYGDRERFYESIGKRPDGRPKKKKIR